MASCGQQSIGKIVTLHNNDGHSHFGGVETCGSVWTCPVCAVKITEGRKEELETILSAHREAGATAYMATFTIPHYRFQKCRDLRKAVTKAWQKVKGGKPWIRARERHGWLGDVRALEVTHGEHGWHPHLHVLIFFNPGTSNDTMNSFGGWLFDAWTRAAERLGYGGCSKGAFDYVKVAAEDGAAGYVGKWGAAQELAKAHVKKGRGGRTPWQILRDYAETKDQGDGKLFKEYAHAFKGARQLTWSRRLREHYRVEPEASDEALAEEPQSSETQMAALSRDLFKVIAAKGKTAHVLTAHDVGGVAAVVKTLTRYGIPWHLSEKPGLGGWMLPYLSLGPPREPRGSPPPPSYRRRGHSPVAKPRTKEDLSWSHK